MTDRIDSASVIFYGLFTLNVFVNSGSGFLARAHGGNNSGAPVTASPPANTPSPVVSISKKDFRVIRMETHFQPHGEV